MESRLAPCPFCEDGGSPRRCGGRDRGYTVCDECGVKRWDWNTRPIEDALAARIAGIEELLSDREEDLRFEYAMRTAAEAKLAQVGSELLPMVGLGLAAKMDKEKCARLYAILSDTAAPIAGRSENDD